VENLRYSRYEAWHRALSAILIISVRCKMMLVDGNLQKKYAKNMPMARPQPVKANSFWEDC
jgi:hypothetical protein